MAQRHTMELAIIFGTPVLIVAVIKYFNFRTRKLELEQGQGNKADQERIAGLLQDRAHLEQRVQNLETIVTSVDLELNARLNRLAASQSQLLLGEGRSVADDAPTRGAAMAGLAAVTGHAGGLRAGSLLADRFEVKEQIGSGGMGAVFRAHDRQLGEEVALKTISANLAEDPDAGDRFRREVGAARKITHRNVIRIHDLGEDQGVLFLSMELFAGATLQALLERRGRLPLAEALPILGQVADALDAAHAAGVVHRDLKPLNVLVNAEGEVRVIDFGLAKASYLRTMTATGVLMGTAEYMAPEQVRGTAADPRSDVYALAAISFHALCGSPPFRAESPIAVGFMHCTAAPPRPRELVAELPQHVEQAILRGLEKDPDLRFGSAALFFGALRGMA